MRSGRPDPLKALSLHSTSKRLAELFQRYGRRFPTAWEKIPNGMGKDSQWHGKRFPTAWEKIPKVMGKNSQGDGTTVSTAGK